MASELNHPSRPSAPLGVREPTRAALPCSRTAGAERPPAAPRSAGPFTFERLERASFAHSAIYAALLVSAFAAGKPEPLTFALGLAHGLLWIAMSLAALAAARLRVIPLRVAGAVVVLGGIGPFFGSAEFVREQRRRGREEGRRDDEGRRGGPR